jgi:hypothetical protein
MNSNIRIVSAVLVGLGTWLLASSVHSARKQTKKLATKKLTKEAVHAWEGEGGALVERAPRPAMG